MNKIYFQQLTCINSFLDETALIPIPADWVFVNTALLEGYNKMLNWKHMIQLNQFNTHFKQINSQAKIIDTKWNQSV